MAARCYMISIFRLHTSFYSVSSHSLVVSSPLYCLRRMALRQCLAIVSCLAVIFDNVALVSAICVFHCSAYKYYVPNCLLFFSAIQIHYNGHHHWVTSGCIGGELTLYDSHISSELPSSLEEQLARIYSDVEDDGRLPITRAASQQQSGGTDCGLFSIAVVYHVARGDDVSKLRFDQGQLREHVSTCFERQILTPFPTTNERVVRCRMKHLSIELFCYCRMPDNFDQNMVQCDACEVWFHFRCCEITCNPETFVCRQCT